jgi:hypothetical protein
MQNKDAWRLLIHLYELANHEGLKFAEKSNISVFETVDVTGEQYACDLDGAARKLGVQKAILTVKLGIFDARSECATYAIYRQTVLGWRAGGSCITWC